MAEDLRRRSEDILLRANQRRLAAEAPEADRTAHAAEMREIRQTVILARDIIQRLRMAAAEGTQTADHIFSPDLSYENLSEEQAKKLKETRKEKEKAEKAESPGFRGRGRGRGRGGYGYHPYHPAPAVYAAPQYIQQQGGSCSTVGRTTAVGAAKLRRDGTAAELWPTGRTGLPSRRLQGGSGHPARHESSSSLFRLRRNRPFLEGWGVPARFTGGVSGDAAGPAQQWTACYARHRLHTTRQR